MYFSDLAVYPNVVGSTNLKCVGWLDRKHEFTPGVTPESVTNILRELLISNRDVNKMRGTHSCEFCAYNIFGEKYVPVSRDAFRNYVYKTTLYLEYEGKKKLLGMSEIWIPSRSGIIYVAPSLIYHYIVTHNYLPPQEFRDAVELFHLNSIWNAESEIAKWLTRQNYIE